MCDVVFLDNNIGSPFEITERGNYRLIEDITNKRININVSNVTIDLNNFSSIMEIASGENIFVLESVEDIIIKNGTLVNQDPSTLTAVRCVENCKVTLENVRITTNYLCIECDGILKIRNCELTSNNDSCIRFFNNGTATRNRVVDIENVKFYSDDDFLEQLHQTATTLTINLQNVTGTCRRFVAQTDLNTVINLILIVQDCNVLSKEKFLKIGKSFSIHVENSTFVIRSPVMENFFDLSNVATTVSFSSVRLLDKFVTDNSIFCLNLTSSPDCVLTIKDTHFYSNARTCNVADVESATMEDSTFISTLTGNNLAFTRMEALKLSSCKLKGNGPTVLRFATIQSSVFDRCDITCNSTVTNHFAVFGTRDNTVNNPSLTMTNCTLKTEQTTLNFSNVRGVSTTDISKIVFKNNTLVYGGRLTWFLYSNTFYASDMYHIFIGDNLFTQPDDTRAASEFVRGITVSKGDTNTTDLVCEVRDNVLLGKFNASVELLNVDSKFLLNNIADDAQIASYLETTITGTLGCLGNKAYNSTTPFVNFGAIPSYSVNNANAEYTTNNTDDDTP